MTCSVCSTEIRAGAAAELPGYDQTPVHLGACLATYRSTQAGMLLSQIRGGILKAIDAERDAQDRKWGRQEGHWAKFWPVLMEEVGEAAAAELEGETPARQAEELIQCAAVIVKRLETLGVKL